MLTNQCSQQSVSLWMARLSNNITKFLLSMGPFLSKEKGVFNVDLKDDAVRSPPLPASHRVPSY